MGGLSNAAPGRGPSGRIVPLQSTTPSVAGGPRARARALTKRASVLRGTAHVTVRSQGGLDGPGRNAPGPCGPSGARASTSKLRSDGNPRRPASQATLIDCTSRWLGMAGSMARRLRVYYTSMIKKNRHRWRRGMKSSNPSDQHTEAEPIVRPATGVGAACLSADETFPRQGTSGAARAA